jgi:hypothetical protein
MSSRCHRVESRLSWEERADLDAIVTIRNTNRSAYIRMPILRDIKQELERHELLRKTYPQQHDHRY